MTYYVLSGMQWRILKVSDDAPPKIMTPKRGLIGS